MEETFVLILLVLVMLVGSYVAGSIPLKLNMSEDILKKVTVLGAGLLVGTALAVIIPEGIRSLVGDVVARNLRETMLAAASKDPETAGVKVERVHHDEGAEQLHFVIGVSLVLGFVFMLVVDQISAKRNQSLSPADRNVTATIGLVVHAAADGIALGAAATTSHADVELIVFVAIMLHKAPAAFGLVTFLLHEGIDRNRIRKHLAVFSCSAPLLTLITYFGIGKEGKETLSSFDATGIAMLFSAGTFLYVATVHVLPELTQGNSHSHHKTHTLLPTEEPNSPGNSVKPKGFSGLTMVELFILVIGMLFPLILTKGHSH